MYYEQYKKAIEQEEDSNLKSAMCEDTLESLFSIIGTTAQFELTGEDAEFIGQCFQCVKQAAYEEGCVKGYRNCINDHAYIKDQHRVQMKCEMLAKYGQTMEEVSKAIMEYIEAMKRESETKKTDVDIDIDKTQKSSFGEMIMNRFCKRA